MSVRRVLPGIFVPVPVFPLWACVWCLCSVQGMSMHVTGGGQKLTLGVFLHYSLHIMYESRFSCRLFIGVPVSASCMQELQRWSSSLQCKCLPTDPPLEPFTFLCGAREWALCLPHAGQELPLHLLPAFILHRVEDWFRLFVTKLQTLKLDEAFSFLGAAIIPCLLGSLFILLNLEAESS